MDAFPSDVLVTIRQHLEEEKVRIAGRIAELQVQDPFSDPDRTNDNAASDTEANEESSHDRFAALLEELKGQLTAIEAALERIAKGTYGFCTNCGEMIDTDRLGILPMATLCLVCEQKKKK
ncbi:TraR/DksA C4-type zinc finger protein [Candidatus Gottesmanbacteria bacterium]|nr:TraR/DksA C4-type zinc finger protein [Candidatus Gottesmanbacteria bacterium]